MGFGVDMDIHIPFTLGMKGKKWIIFNDTEPELQIV